MLTCVDAERLIARYADDPAARGEAERRQLDAHVAVCAACVAALDEQRQVARVLHARAQVPVPPGFEARLSARIDGERAGWLALADWRTWTVGLVPVAAALVLLAWAGPIARGDTTTDTPSGIVATETAGTAPVTFDTWAASYAGSTPAAVFMQPGASGDALLDAVLTGNAPPAGDLHDVR